MSDQFVDKVYGSGVLINLNITNWGGTTVLKPEDIGIDPSKVDSQLLQLGRKNLVPKESMALIRKAEHKAMYLVRTNSFPFGDGIGSFVPYRKLQEVKDGLVMAQVLWRKALDDFLAQYDILRNDMITAWGNYLDTIYPDDGVVVSSILSRIERKYPSKTELEHKFRFDWNIFVIGAPEFPAEQEEDDDIVAAARAAAVNDAYDTMKKTCDELLINVVAELRSRTLDMINIIAEKLQNGSKVHGKTISTVINWYNELQKLDVVGDNQLADAAQELAEKARALAASRKGLSDGEQNFRLQEALKDAKNAIMQLPDATETVQGIGARKVL